MRLKAAKAVVTDLRMARRSSVVQIRDEITGPNRRRTQPRSIVSE
jgi:hypothetical protein